MTLPKPVSTTLLLSGVGSPSNYGAESLDISVPRVLK